MLDVGSNSVHLLVMDAHRGARPLPATSHKIELQLARHLRDDGTVAAAGADALVRCVGECLQIAEDQGAQEVLAFATSALREASKGAAVLERVHAETAVDLLVLPGRAELTRSGRPDLAVGTSKTLRSLARVCGAAPSSDGPHVPRVLHRDALAQALPRLTGLTTAQRAALPGVSPERASQLAAGALVADAAMDLLAVDELLLSPWALREGVLLRRIDAMSADELPV